ncbi:MAG TPA: HAD family phosphatase [Chitinophagaceae bacterium]|nr:HAD family phosphatase [Chitinophagaceae bacterium]
MIKAFLFDLNGTIIDDMQYHVEAWHRILNELGAEISMEETRLQCYGKNHELLDRIFPGRFSEEEKNKMSFEKERQYQDAFRPHMKLIRGLDQFLEIAHARGIKMAIGTAAIMFNVNFILDGLNLRKYFDVIVSADDVAKSKPDPETFLKCSEGLRLKPGECLVFEDSPMGILAAKNAGMKCVALTIMHQKQELNNGNIIKFIDSYSPELFASVIK